MLLGRLKIVIGDPLKQTHAITHTYNHTNSEEKKQRNWGLSVAASRSLPYAEQDLCRLEIGAFPTIEGEYWSTSHKTFLDIGKYRRSMMQVG